MRSDNKVNERQWYYGTNNQGSKFRVVYYKNAKNVWVEFYDHPREKVSIIKTNWGNIQKKEVTDIFCPSIQGVGYLGKTTCTNKDGKVKESYYKWYDMLRRCYNLNYHLKRPTYKDCSVYEEWKCFANFEKDYEELLKENNFPEDIELDLDKDIIFKGNKIYSKENCVLVTKRINTLFIKSNKSRGSFPIGVYYKKKHVATPYSTSLSIMENGKSKKMYLGYFKTPELAFEAYKTAKENYIKQVADEYVKLGYITKESRLFRALINYEVDITD